MKTKLKRATLIVLLVFILATTAIFIFRKQIIEHFIPNVQQVGNIRIDVKNDTCYICPTLELSNETFLGLEIDTVRYDLSVFSNNYWNSSRSLNIELPPYGKDTLSFCIKIPYEDVLSDVEKERERGDSTWLSFCISIQLKTFFVEREIKIRRTRKIKIPRLPEIEVIGITYKEVHLKHMLAEAQVRIINHGSLTLQIKELKYVMTIFKHAALYGSVNRAINVPPFETTYVNIPIEINIDNLGKTVFAIIVNKGRYDYELRLQGVFESKEPINTTFVLEVIADGEMELRN